MLILSMKSDFSAHPRQSSPQLERIFLSSFTRSVFRSTVLRSITFSAGERVGGGGGGGGGGRQLTHNVCYNVIYGHITLHTCTELSHWYISLVSVTSIVGS